MSLLKKLGKPMAVLALTALPFSSLGDWLAQIVLTARTTTGVYTDLTQFGVKTNATANYDSNVDELDSPPAPQGINTFQVLTNSPNALARNYVGTSDATIYRGAIEYTGIAPTSTTAVVNGLPDNNLVMLTFTDNNYSNRNGACALVNGTEINIKTNTKSYMITRAPEITSADFSVANKVRLKSKFYCDGKVSTLDVKAATSLTSPFTNLVGKVKWVNGGDYDGTNTFSSNLRYFKLEVSDTGN